MRFNVRDVLHSLYWRLSEEFTEQIFDIIAPLFVYVGLLMLDFVEELVAIFCVERRQAVDQLVNYRSQTPPIHCFSMTLLLYHLGSQVLRRATNRKSVKFSQNVILG